MSEAPKILIADDDRAFQIYLSRAFRNGGYDVTVVSDGYEALDELRSQDYRFVVIDYDMPKMNGLDLIGEMQKDTKLQDIPFMMISGYDKMELVEKAYSIGVKWFLRKADIKYLTLPAMVNHILAPEIQ